MLSARNISFSYGNQPVLQNLSFSLEKGERLLLLGPAKGKPLFFGCSAVCWSLKRERSSALPAWA